MKNLEEMDKFLKTCNLLRLNHEETKSEQTNNEKGDLIYKQMLPPPKQAHNQMVSVISTKHKESIPILLHLKKFETTPPNYFTRPALL